MVSLAGSVGLVVMSVFLLIFATNYVGEVALVIAVIYFVLVLSTESKGQETDQSDDPQAVLLSRLSRISEGI